MEQILKDFKQFETQLNGEGKSPWHHARKEALQKFLDAGLPSAKNEEYKYTHLGRILKKKFDFAGLNAMESKVVPVSDVPFQDADAIHIYITNGVVNPDFIPEISIDGLEIMTMKDAIEKYPETVLQRFNASSTSLDPFAALNTAFSYEGVFIKVHKNNNLSKPILLHVRSESGELSNTFQSRNIVVVEESATASIIESFTSSLEGDTFSNHITDIDVGANAQLNHIKVQHQSGSSYLVDNTSITQARDSKVQTFTFSLEGQIIRNNLNFALNDENSEAHMYGLYVTHGEAHVDNHTTVDHRVPNCFSNEVYKGILDDHSKGVFNGKIFVREHAQKTNAFQSNKNILLSDTATINTKPQLEIWADDVSCSHGCTTGQLDDEQMFYLRSRGIEKSKARAMLLHAFVNDILDKIEFDFLSQYINDEMYKRLD